MSPRHRARDGQYRRIGTEIIHHDRHFKRSSGMAALTPINAEVQFVHSDRGWISLSQESVDAIYHDSYRIKDDHGAVGLR